MRHRPLVLPRLCQILVHSGKYIHLPSILFSLPLRSRPIAISSYARDVADAKSRDWQRRFRSPAVLFSRVQISGKTRRVNIREYPECHIQRYLFDLGITLRRKLCLNSSAWSCGFYRRFYVESFSGNNNCSWFAANHYPNFRTLEPSGFHGVIDTKSDSLTRKNNSAACSFQYFSRYLHVFRWNEYTVQQKSAGILCKLFGCVFQVFIWIYCEISS